MPEGPSKRWGRLQHPSSSSRLFGKRSSSANRLGERGPVELSVLNGESDRPYGAGRDTREDGRLGSHTAREVSEQGAPDLDRAVQLAREKLNLYADRRTRLEVGERGPELPGLVSVYARPVQRVSAHNPPRSLLHLLGTALQPHKERRRSVRCGERPEASVGDLERLRGDRLGIHFARRRDNTVATPDQCAVESRKRKDPERC